MLVSLSMNPPTNVPDLRYTLDSRSRTGPRRIARAPYTTGHVRQTGRLLIRVSTESAPSHFLLSAARINAKAVTTIIGHSSVATTFDLYRHLFPGRENEARDLLDAYLDLGARPD